MNQNHKSLNISSRKFQIINSYTQEKETILRKHSNQLRMINKSYALSVKNQDILPFYSLYFLKTKMCVIFLLFILGTLCLTAEGAITKAGNFGEKKYFDKKYFPSELSNNSVLSRNLLSCASECLQQQCVNMIYDQGSRDCFINGRYLSFPTGTVFQVRNPNLVIFVEFQQVNVHLFSASH